jgi:hypothetical protein
MMNSLSLDRSRMASVIAAIALGSVSLVGAASPASAGDPCSSSGPTVTCTFTADGSFTVPAGISTLEILAVGGNGAAGGSNGGAAGSGAAVTSDFVVGGGLVSAGQTLTFTVGGNASGRNGGSHGGGDGGFGAGFNDSPTGGGGGGATEVVGSPGPDARLVVAGGGGGGGNGGTEVDTSDPDNPTITPYSGGAGGSSNLTGSGFNGSDGAPNPEGGKGATGSTGGAGGVGGEASGPTGGAGDPTGPGGDGADGISLNLPNIDSWATAGGGGGGAGYAGGGGGGGGGRTSTSTGPELFDFTRTNAAGGGGAAGLSFSAGSNLTVSASDGTPRVEFSYDVQPFTAGPTATITGTAKQGQTLTAHEGSPDPTPDSFGYKWFADGNEISGATSSTFTLTNAQVGTKITVEVTAKKAGYADASDTSDPTATVTGIFDPGPTATITGTARIGSTLTAHRGSVSPTPDKTSYRWFADGKQITDATASTLKLTKSQVGKKITVRIYVAKAGYPTVNDLSEPTSVVSGLTAKRLNLEPDEDTVRVGQTVSPVEISGLSGGEKWTLYFDGTVLKSGKADSKGKVRTSYVVPSAPKGKHVLKVTGRFSDRYDTDTLTIK